MTVRAMDLEPERVGDAGGYPADVDLSDGAVGQFDGQQGDVVGVHGAELRRAGNGARDHRMQRRGHDARTGAMTCWTASIAWVPMSINAPAPAVSFAYRQLNGASAEEP